MTGLLVSVRSATEAQAALLGGADIIDVKEPRYGSLGAASVEVWQQVAAVVADQAQLSVALGELRDFDPLQVAQLPASTVYAKIGLAGCAEIADWPARWQQAWTCLPSHVQRVAVCYVDQQCAAAPSWDQILHQALDAGCKCLLLDTFDKRAGNLFGHWSESQLADVVAQAALEGLFVVAGGSIQGQHQPILAAVGVRFMAVRGAVCRGTRTGPLQADLVKQLRAVCDASGPSVFAG